MRVPGQRAGRRSLRSHTPSEREEIARYVEQRLAPAMSALGIVFLLVVLGATLSREGSLTSAGLEVVGWILWVVFAVEFLARLVIAPSTLGFLRRNWWQLAFLLLPFLRFIRAFQLMRLGRAGRIVSSAVRTGRTARIRLADRVGWLAALTAVVVLGASQVLYALGAFSSYGEALYRTAYATISGEPMQRDTALVHAAEITLATYSVVVFAALAGSLGSYFVERRD